MTAVREAQGLSQAELCRRAGIDAGYLSRVESGKQKPSIAFLRLVGRELGLRNLVEAVDTISRFR